MSFPHYMQLDQMDCGPSCLRMIAKYYGRSFSLQYLRERCFLTREGVSFLGISDAADNIGFRTQGVRMNLHQLAENAPLPCILHWKQNHFVVCYKIKRSQRKGIVRYRFQSQTQLRDALCLSKKSLNNAGSMMQTKMVNEG